MLHIVESRNPLDRVAKDLEEAVAHHKFGILGVHEHARGRLRRTVHGRASPAGRFLPLLFAAAARSLPDLGILANSSRLLRQR
jgi:hypothetical protein